ncbi:hypothetical protein ACFQ9X_24820 [Catenulispora yoronensis]
MEAADPGVQGLKAQPGKWQDVDAISRQQNGVAALGADSEADHGALGCLGNQLLETGRQPERLEAVLAADFGECRGEVAGQINAILRRPERVGSRGGREIGDVVPVKAVAQCGEPGGEVGVQVRQAAPGVEHLAEQDGTTRFQQGHRALSTLGRRRVGVGQRLGGCVSGQAGEATEGPLFVGAQEAARGDFGQEKDSPLQKIRRPRRVQRRDQRSGDTRTADARRWRRSGDRCCGGEGFRRLEDVVEGMRLLISSHQRDAELVQTARSLRLALVSGIDDTRRDENRLVAVFGVSDEIVPTTQRGAEYCQARDPLTMALSCGLHSLPTGRDRLIQILRILRPPKTVLQRKADIRQPRGPIRVAIGGQSDGLAADQNRLVQIRQILRVLEADDQHCAQIRQVARQIVVVRPGRPHRSPAGLDGLVEVAQRASETEPVTKRRAERGQRRRLSAAHSAALSRLAAEGNRLAAHANGFVQILGIAVEPAPDLQHRAQPGQAEHPHAVILVERLGDTVPQAHGDVDGQRIGARESAALVGVRARHRHCGDFRPQGLGDILSAVDDEVVEEISQSLIQQFPVFAFWHRLGAVPVEPSEQIPGLGSVDKAGVKSRGQPLGITDSAAREYRRQTQSTGDLGQACRDCIEWFHLSPRTPPAPPVTAYDHGFRAWIIAAPGSGATLAL